MYFWRVCFSSELGFLNCDDICMCVVNKQFELLMFVFYSVYVDLHYDEISLSFTAGFVSLCVVMWSSLFCMDIYFLVCMWLSDLDLSRHHPFYDEQRQTSSGSAWPACLKNSKSFPQC